MTARGMSAFCLAAALVAVIYIGVSGARWPLSFVAIMIVVALVVAISAIFDSEGPRDGR